MLGRNVALPDIKPLENIHLHHNIKIKGEIWRRAMALKKPSLFVSMISKEIWTAEELKQKCVKKSKKTAGRLEQLSPQKKEAMEKAFSQYLRGNGCDEEAGNLNKYLNRVITTSRR